MIIKPTVGRKVWYRPSEQDIKGGMVSGNSQPIDATIVFVHSDRMVNLALFDANGMPHQRTSVDLVQDDGGASNQGGGYCEWMPFQTGQARAHAKAAESDEMKFAPESPLSATSGELVDPTGPGA